MQSVTVAKDKLVAILTANRAKHLAEYNDSVIKFRQAARKLLTEALDAIVPDNAPVQMDSSLKDMYLHLEAPKQYLKEYDKALKMLDLSVKAEIELASEEFSYYVDDDWEWKERFTASNRSYHSMTEALEAKAYHAGPIG